MRVLFLQLPRLNEDSISIDEDLPLAALYLRETCLQAGLTTGWDFILPSSESYLLDDRHLRDYILALQPELIAATLTLWNVERTLELFTNLRALCPELLLVAGGPEVAVDHPFLFTNSILDAAVIGEGEAVAPALFTSLCDRQAQQLSSVAYRTATGYTWGTVAPPTLSLTKSIPFPCYPGIMPNDKGQAGMETVRGCPMRCSYCRYNHLRHEVISLPIAECLRRVQCLKDTGAKEIRFIDPTLNAHPDFPALLKGLCDLNPAGELSFFGEVNAASLSMAEIPLLIKAGFTELEAGIQSRSPAVRKAIRRQESIEHSEINILALRDAEITVTLDLMYGLPLQRLEDALSDIDWANSLAGVNLQCFPTLLLPGTDLRAERMRWGLQGIDLPPYTVLSTPQMSAGEMVAVEEYYEKTTGFVLGHSSECFVGEVLPDLFPEQISINIANLPVEIPGSSNRRALLIAGNNLYAASAELCAFVKRCIKTEPHILWQFVLAVTEEEPLDILDALIATLKSIPGTWHDRSPQVEGRGRLLSRRIFVKLPEGSQFDPDWQMAAEELLTKHFL